MKMKNETALITGSTSGIGKTMAETFLKEGCKVAICSRNEDRVKATLEEFKAKYNDAVIGFTCDVASPSDLANVVQQTIEAFGSLRILVANAGMSMEYGPFEYLDPETVDCNARQILGTNLIGMINTIAAVLPQMKKQNYGRIITLTGGGADRPLENMTLYSASKGGVAAFSKCLALELQQSHPDIKLNIYQPGMQRTGLMADVKVVPNWRSCVEVQQETELALQYMGGNIQESVSKVVPFVCHLVKRLGKLFWVLISLS